MMNAINTIAVQNILSRHSVVPLTKIFYATLFSLIVLERAFKLRLTKIFYAALFSLVVLVRTSKLQFYF